MLNLEDPFTHASDLREYFLLLLMQTHNRLEPLESLLARLVHCLPFFSSFSRLV
jgi:hypothetical protein